MKNDDDNDELCYIELDFDAIRKGTIYENNEKTIEKLNEENLFNINDKRLIYIIINRMKNEDNGKAFHKLFEEQSILEAFVL